MTHGIEIKNAAGDIVVDSRYKNFMHLFTQNLALTFEPDNYNSDSNAYEAKRYSFPFAITSYAPPILSIRVTQNRLATGAWIGSPGNWTGVYMITDMAGLGSGSKTCSMEVRGYVAADSGQLNPSGDYGLQVFDAGGGKIFDSRIPPLIVVRQPVIYFPSDPWNRVGSAVLAADSGQGLDAACLGWISGRATGTAAAVNHEYFKAFRGTGGNVTIRRVMTAYEDGLTPPPVGMDVLGTNIHDVAQALVFRFR